MYQYLWSSLCWIWLLLCWQGAFAQNEYLIEFDTGKTAISLAQVAAIQSVARELGGSPIEKIVVYAYASDAQGSDTNERLARRRSYLIQQCLERAGVPLSRLHLRHFTCGPEELGCPMGARIWVERHRTLEATNAYQDRNREYVWNQLAEAYEEIFTIQPHRDTFLTLRRQGMVFIPQGTFDTDQPMPIVVTIRHLGTRLDQWLHGLEGNNATIYGARELLDLQATQNGQPLPRAYRHPISLVLWNRQVHLIPTMPYWYQNGQWEEASSSALQLWGVHAEQATAARCTQTMQALELPDFATPPQRPAYEHPDSATALQDAAIAALTERLQALEGLRYSKTGKKEIWTPQQKQKVYTLTNQRAKLLVQREERRRKVVLQNAALEEQYYKTVAAYNQHRHQQQRQFLDQQFTQGQQTVQRTSICGGYQARQAYLRLIYTMTQLEQFRAKLREQPLLNEESEHYWMLLTEQGTWGFHVKTTEETAAPKELSVQVKTPISAYKVTAALDLGKKTILGEPVDANTLQFQGIPALLRRGQLWAVVEGREGYEVATMELQFTPTEALPTLSFQPIAFKTALLGLQPVEPE